MTEPAIQGSLLLLKLMQLDFFRCRPISSIMNDRSLLILYEC